MQAGLSAWAVAKAMSHPGYFVGLKPDASTATEDLPVWEYKPKANSEERIAEFK
jgi:hypothetical protein